VIEVGLFDSLMEAFSTSPEWVGKRFEKYVLDMFDDNFTIVEQTHSFKTNQERYVESSMNPDYVLRHKPTKSEFAVEVKYRSKLDKGMLHWSNPNQLKRYNEFAIKRKIPVYVLIGFGGYEEEPDDMFLIPLQDAKYPALYPSVFQQFSRNPKKDFYWKNGKLY
jgi:hypothetical protein